MRARAPARRRSGGGGREPFHWTFTTPLFLGSTLNPVNSSLIATALASIAVFLHIPAGRVVVLVSSLYLACAIAQPTFGKLSEVFGPRRVFVCGIVLVFAGGLIGGLGENLLELIVARVVIGVGTSAAYPSAMLLIRRRAREAELDEPPGGVLGGLQIAGVATAALGLPLGGVLVQVLGWRAVFYANLPVAGIALLLAVAWLPSDPPVERMSAREACRRVDLTGIVLFGAMMVALLIFLDALPGTPWPWLAVAVAVAVGLVGWELRAAEPFIDVRLLARNRALTRTYLRFALLGLCVYTVLYGLTEWLEVARGASAEGAGLLMLPMTGMSALAMGWVSRRNLIRGPLIVSAVVAGLGAIAIALLRTSTPTIWIIGVSLLFGIVMATFTANQTALYRQAEPEQIATASGLLRTFGYLGSIGSSAIVGVVFHHRVDDAGLHRVAFIMLAAAAVALLLALADRSLGGGAGATGGSRSRAEPARSSPAAAHPPARRPRGRASARARRTHTSR